MSATFGLAQPADWLERRCLSKADVRGFLMKAGESVESELLRVQLDGRSFDTGACAFAEIRPQPYHQPGELPAGRGSRNSGNEHEICLGG
jgi:hypothetical protein